MIALIGCVKTKLNVSGIRARDIYISPLFKKSVKFIESQKYEDWFILSAKYGLIEKEKIIDTYELTLSSFSINELKNWSQKIYCEIKDRKLDNLYFYCGSLYHNKFLLNLLQKDNIQYYLPLEKMSLGQRLSFFNKMNKNKGFFL